ncbi:MAG: hypothetical protein ABIQ90_09215 [Polaromonas sp.]
MTPAQNPAPFPKETVKAAIAEGKALIKDGKTKVEATTAKYAKLKNADRETTVAAFMEGAGLIEEGAVTYLKEYGSCLVMKYLFRNEIA